MLNNSAIVGRLTHGNLGRRRGGRVLDDAFELISDAAVHEAIENRVEAGGQEKEE